MSHEIARYASLITARTFQGDVPGWEERIAQVAMALNFPLDRLPWKLSPTYIAHSLVEGLDGAGYDLERIYQVLVSLFGETPENSPPFSLGTEFAPEMPIYQLIEQGQGDKISEAILAVTFNPHNLSGWTDRIGKLARILGLDRQVLSLIDWNRKPILVAGDVVTNLGYEYTSGNITVAEFERHINSIRERQRLPQY